MKLFFVEPSPFSRKARVVALLKDISLDLVKVMPGDEKLLKFNMLGQLPILILDDGQCIIDSTPICKYLDRLPSCNESVMPKTKNLSGLAIQKNYYLADGIIVAAVKIVYERKRPIQLQSVEEIAKQQSKINNALIAIRNLMEFGADSTFGEKINIFHITLACALGYLDFRIPDLNWRLENDKLNEWYRLFSQHSFMIETEPEKTFVNVLNNNMHFNTNRSTDIGSKQDTNSQDNVVNFNL
ncbi:MAG: glutathione S-transferase N-terminal domain-containing protein [Gammaproteobacteria bacterium]